MRLILDLTAAILAVSLVGCQTRQASSQTEPKRARQAQGQPVEAELPPPGNPVVGRKPPMPAPVVRADVPEYRVETFASGLVIPWDMAFVSQNRVYVTERPGRVRLIGNGNLQPQPYATVDVLARGEGGLMGIALHPKYPNPRWVYLMYTSRKGGTPRNRISRFTDTGTGLTDEHPLVTGIPAGNIHNGGIIRFGPDGMLYAGTGETGQPELAQDRSSLGGKILRMTPEGRVPPDNPFSGSLVYAYGLRNVQGLAWNPKTGDLWATMHGPTGEFGLYAMDSVFIVPKGGNAGWPRALGVTGLKGVVQPVLFYPGVANPPGRAIFYTGSLMPGLSGNFFFTSLGGEHLERVVLSGPRMVSRIERWWQTGEQEGRYGRLRAIAQGPDGALYISTSNRDGRGVVRPGDDKILRVSPK